MHHWYQSPSRHMLGCEITNIILQTFYKLTLSTLPYIKLPKKLSKRSLSLPNEMKFGDRPFICTVLDQGIKWFYYYAAIYFLTMKASTSQPGQYSPISEFLVQHRVHPRPIWSCKNAKDNITKNVNISPCRWFT